jgi:hypothetical protein
LETFLWPRKIDNRDFVKPEKIPVAIKKIVADESHAYHIPGAADAETSSVHIGRREIDRRKRTAAQDIGMALGFALKAI